MGIMSYGGAGVNLNLRGQPTNNTSLAAGASYIIPAGPFLVNPGPYSFVQFKDPITGEWRMWNRSGTTTTYVESDGVNWRIANLSGCVIGAKLTTAGSAYTAVPTLTFSSGGAAATAIMGQVLSTTVQLTTPAGMPAATSGANYTLAPTCIISAPAAGGLPAKAIAVITNGAVSSVTIIDQGAGYGAGPASVAVSNNQPTITFVTNPEDPNINSTTNPITPATATVSLDASSAGTVTGIIITNPGTPLTSVPTISFSSGAAAATSLMAFTVTAQTVSGGSGYVVPVKYTTSGGVVATASAYLSTYNPLFIPRDANGTVALTGTALSTVTIIDGGLFQAIPSAIVLQNGTVSVGTIATPTVGGVTDSFVLQGI